MHQVQEQNRMIASTQPVSGAAVESVGMSIARQLAPQLQQQQVPIDSAGFVGVTDLSPGPGRAGDRFFDTVFQQQFRMITGLGNQRSGRNHSCSEATPIEQFDSSSAVYFSGLAPQQAQILGQEVVNGDTTASAGSRVAGRVDETSTELSGEITSAQVSGVGEPAVSYQSQNLPSTSLSQAGLGTSSLATFPVHSDLSGNANNQASDLDDQVGDLGQYRNLSFDLNITTESVMGGGNVYPQPERQQQLLRNINCSPDMEQATSREAINNSMSIPRCLPGAPETTLGESRPSDVVLFSQQPGREFFMNQMKLEQLPDDMDEVDYALVNQSTNVPMPQPPDPEDKTQRTKKRSAFDDARRKETADTRWRKACLRCRVQKVRCGNDPDNPEADCLPCQMFSKTSKKTIHRVSCYRGKLTDTVLYRKGGLNLTDRWNGTAMKDVGDRINPQDIRTIHFTIGVCDQPIVVQVVRFSARPGDVTARYWIVREGGRGEDVRKKKDLEPYCLANIWDTANYFENYIVENAIPSMLRTNMPSPQLQGIRSLGSQDVIKRTYIAAVEYYASLEDQVDGPSGKTDNPEKKLLGNLFILWFATRHTAGSAYICGDESLGMKPETKDETYPLFGKVSLPRMILAQFDSINHTKLLSKYGRKVLQDLEGFVFRNQARWWWAIYLCVFILLHEASFISADRYRHARNNLGHRFRYSIPKFVEELQEGCNNILMHWHYYNCKPWPDPSEPWCRHKSFLADLSSEQYDLVMETMTDPRVQRQLEVWKRYKLENGYVDPPESQVTKAQAPYVGRQAQFDWDHPFYWISQIFEERWSPHPTYQREYVC
ncbi:endo-polygalacturonase PG1 [Purpureocillium lavendulum]|uniref:Endo-polygalacturonase PG1 n=1 Tax=Purpureocillium lavendulum TaxID=1247861 RepID=A0AB34FQC9_9HYPO|nr:endo-polygalacturonase PG1 [Purpureocillium lavendulum]